MPYSVLFFLFFSLFLFLFLPNASKFFCADRSQTSKEDEFILLGLKRNFAKYRIWRDRMSGFLEKDKDEEITIFTEIGAWEVSPQTRVTLVSCATLISNVRINIKVLCNLYFYECIFKNWEQWKRKKR